MTPIRAVSGIAAAGLFLISGYELFSFVSGPSVLRFLCTASAILATVVTFWLATHKCTCDDKKSK